MDDHFIIEIDNAISPELCKRMIKKFEESPHKKQDMIEDPVNKTLILDLERRDSMSLTFSTMNDWNDIDEELCRSLSNGLKVYEREFKKKIEKIGEDPEFLYPLLVRGCSYIDSGYNIIRVNPGSWYRWHHDHTYDMTILRCIWYLNDIDDKDGGHTKFINGRSIKPEAGKLVIFPTTWTHIHSGSKVHTEKYISTTTISIK